MTIDWKYIQTLYDSGMSVSEICNIEKISPGSVSYASKKGRLKLLSLKDGIRRKRVDLVDWVSVQKFYDNNHTIEQTAIKFNLKKQNISTNKNFVSRDKSKQSDMMVKTRNQNNSWSHTDKTKKILSQYAKNRGLGGRFYRNLINYNGVILESSYELTLAIDLDKNGISWERPLWLNWIDTNGISRRYTADFYLSEYDIYLDPKNDYLISMDIEKIKLCSEQNNVKIYIMNKNQLTWSDVKKLAGIV